MVQFADMRMHYLGAEGILYIYIPDFGADNKSLESISNFLGKDYQLESEVLVRY